MYVYRYIHIYKVFQKTESKFETQLCVKSVVHAIIYLYFKSSGFLLLNDTIFVYIRTRNEQLVRVEQKTEIIFDWICLFSAVLKPGASCIKKWLKLTMISGNVNQPESRILYLISI